MKWNATDPDPASLRDDLPTWSNVVVFCVITCVASVLITVLVQVVWRDALTHDNMPPVNVQDVLIRDEARLQEVERDVQSTKSTLEELHAQIKRSQHR